MDAANLLTDLFAHGLTLKAHDNRLIASPAGKLSADVCDLIRAHKPELIALLTTPRRRWLVVQPDGTATSHSLTPAATLAEMQHWHPGTEIHPEPDHDEMRDAA